jgi:hypothetical protein
MIPVWVACWVAGLAVAVGTVVTAVRIFSEVMLLEDEE